MRFAQRVIAGLSSEKCWIKRSEMPKIRLVFTWKMASNLSLKALLCLGYSKKSDEVDK